MTEKQDDVEIEVDTPQKPAAGSGAADGQQQTGGEQKRKSGLPPEVEAELLELAKLPAGIELKQKCKELGQRLNPKVDYATVMLEVAQRQPKQQAPQTPTAEQVKERIEHLAEQAGGLINETDILAKVGHQIEAAGLVGETANAKLLYLALTSRLLDWPVSVAVKGVSAGRQVIHR
jgi:hypothetical protein